MHPLLVNAVASTAGNFLDRWARGAGAAAPATPAVNFQNVLDAKASAATTKTPAGIATDRLAQLRRDLLEAPEIRAVLDTADPGKPAKLSLTADGRVLHAAPGRDARPILLSPGTAEIARELAALAAPSASLAVSAQVSPGLPARDLRAGALDLTPQTAVTSLR
jgi:hypothetical protein